MILILEDNPDRTRRFLAAAAAVAPGLPVKIWPHARIHTFEPHGCSPAEARKMAASICHSAHWYEKHWKPFIDGTRGRRNVALSQRR
jgi:hypothetical protein